MYPLLCPRLAAFVVFLFDALVRAGLRLAVASVRAFVLGDLVLPDLVSRFFVVPFRAGLMALPPNAESSPLHSQSPSMAMSIRSLNLRWETELEAALH